MTHLVTGATGALGQEIIAALEGRGALDPVAFGARNPAALAERGLAARRLDYDDAASLAAALTGIETLLLVSSNADNETRKRQHQAVIEAAVRSGVQRIVYTSFVGAAQSDGNELLGVHAHTEALLRDSGVPWVALRNGLYLDMLPAFLGPFRDSKVVAHPTGDAQVAWITRKDIAAYTVDVLLDGGVVNQVLDVVGTQPLSMGQIVAAVADKAGVDVRYVQPSDADYRAALVSAGFDRNTVGVFSDVCRAMREGRASVTSESFLQRLGRRPESVHEFLARTV